MSTSRRPLTRPRTKVYDCNYDAGQQYYKSTLDSLDRKYGRGSAPPESNGALTSLLRPSAERERRELSPLNLPKRRPVVEYDEDDYLPSSEARSPRSAALINEFDSIFESRGKLNIRAEKKSKLSKALDNEIEEDISSSIKRLRARAAEDTELDVVRPSLRSKLDQSEGSDSRSSRDESRLVAKRRVVTVTTSSDSSALGDDKLTKWTSLESGDRRRHALDEEPDSAASMAAAARARKSRARLNDLETEMQELTDKNAAREKRIRDLKSFMAENDMESSHASQSQSVQSVKVRSSAKSEKKIVSF